MLHPRSIHEPIFCFWRCQIDIFPKFEFTLVRFTVGRIVQGSPKVRKQELRNPQHRRLKLLSTQCTHILWFNYFVNIQGWEMSFQYYSSSLYAVQIKTRLDRHCTFTMERSKGFPNHQMVIIYSTTSTVMLRKYSPKCMAVHSQNYCKIENLPRKTGNEQILTYLSANPL